MDGEMDGCLPLNRAISAEYAELNHQVRDVIPAAVLSHLNTLRTLPGAEKLKLEPFPHPALRQLRQQQLNLLTDLIFLVLALTE